MGIFDGLFKSKQAPEEVPPEVLREQLFASIGDQRRLLALCKARQDEIRAHFPSWQQVPEAVRNDPQALQRYVPALIAIATCFAEQLHDPSLMRRMMGEGRDNPISRWQETLRRAREQMDQLRYHETIPELTELIATLRQHQGSAPQSYLPIAYGFLGECYFQLGEADQALAPMEEALRGCWDARDAEGVVSYLGNLYEVQRYRGAAAEAAQYAERLAGVLDQLGQQARAARYRAQAAIVRAGEPLNRVVVVAGEQQWELKALPPQLSGHMRFLFERNRITLRPAQRLTERGQEQGAAGKHDQALDLFVRAAEADHFAPHPRYEQGLTLLYLQRYAEAVTAFAETERLAPGWFNCRADRWLAEQLAAGSVTHASFLALRQLEDGNLPPGEAAQLAQHALQDAPGRALLHLAYGRALAALQRVSEAVASFRTGLSCVEDEDTRTRLLLQLGLLLEGSAERRALLREAAALSGNLTAAAMAHVALLEGC